MDKINSNMWALLEQSKGHLRNPEVKSWATMLQAIFEGKESSWISLE